MRRYIETFCTTQVKQYRNAKHDLSRFLVMTGTEITIVLALRYCLTCVVQKVSISSSVLKPDGKKRTTVWFSA